MSIHTTSNSLTVQGKSAPQAQQSRGYWGYAEMSEDDIKKTAGAGCGGCGGCGGSGDAGDASDPGDPGENGAASASFGGGNDAPAPEDQGGYRIPLYF